MLSDGWFEPEEFPAWRRRVRQEQLARNFTVLGREILVTLTGFVGDEGLFPSDKAVADRLGCSDRSVRRVRGQARDAGLLRWEKQRQLVDGKWRQGSNRYTLLMPPGPVVPKPRPACPGGQDVRGTKKKEASKRLRSTMQDDGPVGFSSWGEVREKRRQAVLADWQSKRKGVRCVM